MSNLNKYEIVYFYVCYCLVFCFILLVYCFSLSPLLCQDEIGLGISDDMFYVMGKLDCENNKVTFDNDYDSGIDSPRMPFGYINSPNIGNLDDLSSQEIYEFYYR
jgi:hypothetical protein